MISINVIGFRPIGYTFDSLYVAIKSNLKWPPQINFIIYCARKLKLCKKWVKFYNPILHDMDFQKAWQNIDVMTSRCFVESRPCHYDIYQTDYSIVRYSIQFILNRLHYFLLGQGVFPWLVGNSCIITRLNLSQAWNRIYNINYFASTIPLQQSSISL